MKILFIQKMNGISGSELYMLQIMPELKRRGYDMEMLIIYPTPGNNNGRFIDYLAEHGIKTHEIYNHHALSPILFYKFYKILKKGKFDLVQANLVHADFLATVTKFWLMRKLKIISVKHGYYPAYQSKYGTDLKYIRRNAYYWIEKFASNIANFNITISKGLYNVFVTGGIVKQSRIKNIYYGLTLTEPIEHQSKVEVPVDPFVLITGRLLDFKGHKYLVKAWANVNKVNPGLKLYLAGSGIYRAELEKQVAQSGLQSSIIFLGHVPNPHPLMEKCLFTVVTSNFEGFGLILLESWLHKKAIVSFDAPAMNEVIEDGKTGLLVKANDTDDLADKINYLYNNPQIAIQYGEAGFEKLNSYYTLKRMADETEEVYHAVYENKQVRLV